MPPETAPLDAAMATSMRMPASLPDALPERGGPPVGMVSMGRISQAGAALVTGKRYRTGEPIGPGWGEGRGTFAGSVCYSGRA